MQEASSVDEGVRVFRLRLGLRLRDYVLRNFVNVNVIVNGELIEHWQAVASSAV